MTDDFIDNYANYVSLVLATVLVFFSSISVYFYFIFLFGSDQPGWNTVCISKATFMILFSCLDMLWLGHRHGRSCPMGKA